MMIGKFIVFEGGEGSGKSTMSKRVVEWLKERGVPVRWTREPGGSPYAEKIREIILSDEAKEADAETMFGLFWAARRDHLKNTVLPSLREGTHVISDRFDSSTWAYQIHAQEQDQLRELFGHVRKHYLSGVPEAHYIVLDVPPEVGLARAKSRGEKLTHFDKRDLAFHGRVRKGLLEFATMTIDASKPIEEVWQEVRAAVEKVLG